MNDPSGFRPEGSCFVRIYSYLRAILYLNDLSEINNENGNDIEESGEK